MNYEKEKCAQVGLHNFHVIIALDAFYIFICFYFKLICVGAAIELVGMGGKQVGSLRTWVPMGTGVNDNLKL